MTTPMVPRLQPNAPSESFNGGTMMPAAMLMELAKIWTVAKIPMTTQL